MSMFYARWLINRLAESTWMLKDEIIINDEDD